jgi:beta-glucanase (GH16 family)
MPKLGNGGKDGSEIDVYESAFVQNPTKTGSAVHWDSYEPNWHRVEGTVIETEKDLYDSWHTWGLLWTPNSYSFYLDGQLLWMTGVGGISQVPEFLRLTCEITRGAWGPYGQPLGPFEATKDDPAEFLIDYVRIYQHPDFEKFIKSPEDFKQPLLAQLFQKDY